MNTLGLLALVVPLALTAYLFLSEITPPASN